MSDPDRWYVRAEVKDLNPPYEARVETRNVAAHDAEGAKDRFEYLVESEDRKVRRFIGVVQNF